MKRQIYLLFLSTLFISINVLGQKLRPVPQMILDAKMVDAEFAPIKNLLVIDKTTDKKTTKEQGVQYFTYDTEIARELLQNPEQYLSIYLPYEDENGNDIVLDLINLSDRRNDYLIRTSSGRYERTTLLGQHFSGVVRGKEDNTSIVSISIFENQIMGIVSLRNNGTINIGRTKNKQKHIIYNDNITKSSSSNFSCAFETDESSFNNLSDIYNSLDSTIQGEYETIDKCIEVYIEVGNAMYQHFNQNVTEVEQFVIGIFNQVATIYLNEGIIMKISEIEVWETTGNPTGSLKPVLISFRNNTPNFNGHLAHFLDFQQGTGGTDYGSNTNPNANGIAYIGELCNNAPYGFTRFFPDYLLYPNYSRQVKVLTHELGHNLGSLHTQVCAWNGDCSPLDGCNSPQFLTDSYYSSFNCFEESCSQPPAPTEPGTIMSYCDYPGDPGVDLTLGFGNQPNYVIRNFVNQLATCVDPCLCPFSLNHGPNENIATNHFTVETIISSQADIDSNANVIYDAGTTVLLSEDFESDASNGSVFCALIGGCTPSNNTSTLFDDYDWLSGVISPTNCCSGQTATEYTSGSFFFLLVTGGSCNSNDIIYDEWGGIYCQNTPNYCIDFYSQNGFTDTGNTWSCSGTSNKTESKASFETLETKEFTIAPNPFDNVFSIHYEIVETAPISIAIYGLDGQLLKTILNNEIHEKGNYSKDINGTDLPVGVYLVKLLNGNDQQVKRLVKMK